MKQGLALWALLVSVHSWAYQDRQLVGHFSRLTRCNLVENVNKADISLVEENGISKIKIRFSGHDEITTEVMLGTGKREIPSPYSSHEILKQNWNAQVSFGGIWATETVRDNTGAVRSYAIKRVDVDGMTQSVTYYESQYKGLSEKPYFERQCALYR